MLKRYFKTFYKAFLVITVFVLLLNLFITRKYSQSLPYNLITISTMLLTIFTALAIRVFKSEKGNGYINAILGYVIIIPTLFIIRKTYGTYLFRFTYTIYIIMAIIGVIYGIALLVARKKYKTEVDELNRLLLKKENLNDEEEE